MDSDANSIEVVYEPGVHVNWALQVTTFTGSESGPTTSRSLVPSTLQIEQMISTHIDRHGAGAARVVHTFGGRDVYFRDGSRTEFRWELLVADWRCLDCGVDTDNVDGSGRDEYFMIHDELWLSINPERVGHLCIACTEARLGRFLMPTDFKAARVNMNPRRRSRRLTSRIQGA